MGLEELEEFDALDAEVKEPERPKREPKPTSKSVEHLRETPETIVTGDFAKSQAPSFGMKRGKTAIQDFEDLISEEISGSPHAKKMLISKPEVVKIREEKPKTALEDFEELLATDQNMIDVRGFQAKQGSSALRGVMRVLSWEENQTVKGLNALMGRKEKIFEEDYTWSNFLKETGWGDHLGTDGAGLVLAIALAPSTYLTLGAGGVAKAVAGKGAGKVVLTKSGRHVADEIVKKRGDKIVAEAIAKVGDKGLQSELLKQFSKSVGKTVKSENELRQVIKTQVDDQVTKKFLKIRNANSKLGKVDEDVNKVVTDGVFDPGGIQLAGIPLIKGETIAKTMQAVRLPETILLQANRKKIAASAKAAAITSRGVSRAIPVGARKHFIDPVIEKLHEGKVILGKAFVPNFGIERTMVKTTEDANVVLLQKIKGMKESNERFFRGLNDRQRKDFAESAIQASTVDKPIFVKALSGDASVQRKLDVWFGQRGGKRIEGKGVAEAFKKWSGLVEDQKLANWFPGIDQNFARPTNTVFRTFGRAEREFLKERIGDPDNYIRDPVQALLVRRSQIVAANLQDQIYDNIVTKGIGGVSTKKLGADYIPFARPRDLTMLEGRELSKKEAVQYWAPRKFVDQWEQKVRGPQRKNLLLRGAGVVTNYWKSTVTVLFPGFHAINHLGNTILNSYSIGLTGLNAGINPATFKKGFSLAVRNVDPPKDLLGKTIYNTTKFLVGDKKFINKKMTSSIGENFTPMELLKEAQEHGAVSDMFFDITGTAMKGDRGKKLQRMLSYANPLSQDWKPFVFGRNFANAIETQARMTNYIFHRMRGINPELAAKATNDALFDYGAITNFEQGAKMVIPFYTFSSKNLKKHVQLLASKPGAVTAQLKMMQKLGPTNEEWDELMPEWAQKKFLIRGNTLIAQGFNIPLTDVLELTDMDFRQAMMRINPMIRLILEKGVQKDFFSDRNLMEANNGSEFKFLLEWSENKSTPKWKRIIADQMVKTLKLERDQKKPEKVVMSPNWRHALANSFTSRFQSVAAFAQREDRNGYDTALKIMTGIATVPQDYETALFIAKKNASKKLVKKILETNLGRVVEFTSGKRGRERPKIFFLGRDKFSTKLINSAFSDVHNAATRSEIQVLLKEADQIFEEEQKARVEEGLAK